MEVSFLSIFRVAPFQKTKDSMQSSSFRVKFLILFLIRLFKFYRNLSRLKNE